MKIERHEVEAGDYVAYTLRDPSRVVAIVVTEVLGEHRLRGITVPVYFPTCEASDYDAPSANDRSARVIPRGTATKRKENMHSFPLGGQVRAKATLSVGPLKGKVLSDLTSIVVVETESGKIAVGDRCNWASTDERIFGYD